MKNEKIKVLGIVGARSGSKGIPGKNIRPLLGKPLMAWVIEAAKKSKYAIRIVVSTDSLEYAEVAKKCGAEAPFLRPHKLAEDSVPDIDYMRHAALWMEENEGWRADIILRLPPTAPLCTTKHIDRCVELLLEDPAADSARTITKAAKHPYKLWGINGEYLEPFLPPTFTGVREAHNMARQNFPAAYQHVDVIALRRKTLIENNSMAGDKIRYHIIPRAEAVDIDDELDFTIAEILLKRKLEQKD